MNKAFTMTFRFTEDVMYINILNFTIGIPLVYPEKAC